MPLVVSPVLLPDLPAIQRLSLSVEADTATGSLLFPNGASETSIAHLVKQDEKDIRDPKCTCRHIIMRHVPEGTDTYGDDGKAIGEIVSYAMWNFFVGREKANIEGQDKVERVGDGADYENWPPDAHHEALEVLVEMGRKKREGTMGQRKYAFLASLCTSPTHRRMGAASKLIEWGLALADAHLLPTYVESTPGALPLYLKHGFEKVDTMTVDLHQWGRDHVQEHTILIRPAKKPSTAPDEIRITPVLTNADFTAFDSIEKAAFTPEPTSQAPPPKEAPKPTSIFPLIRKDVPLTSGPSPRITFLNENSITDPTSHYLKAFIPSTNTTIAFALFQICPTPSLCPQRIPWPHGANHALVDAFFGKMHQAEERYMDGKLYILLHALAVVPRWQGKGVGRGLLECWVDASREGVGLYRKLGWRGWWRGRC